MCKLSESSLLTYMLLRCRIHVTNTGNGDFLTQFVRNRIHVECQYLFERRLEDRRNADVCQGLATKHNAILVQLQYFLEWAIN